MLGHPNAGNSLYKFSAARSPVILMRILFFSGSALRDKRVDPMPDPPPTNGKKRESAAHHDAEAPHVHPGGVLLAGEQDLRGAIPARCHVVR